MDRSSTSGEILFHGLPSKIKHPSIRKQVVLSLPSKFIILLFLQNIHLQRHIWQSYFSKVAGFYRSSHRRYSVKKVLLERCLQNSQENNCVRDTILIKLQA